MSFGPFLLNLDLFFIFNLDLIKFTKTLIFLINFDFSSFVINYTCLYFKMLKKRKL